ncbi:MAG: hypothetical protein KQI35_16085 [Bacteroidetes bacterium]|nr:hypothetical protein [Bacteroidota bacterium]
MKNLFLILVMVLFTTIGMKAQDIRPAVGQVALEVNFTPLSASPIGLNYLKGRYLMSEDMVFRLGVDIRVHSDKSEPINGADPDINDERKMSYTQFGLYPGIEKHFGNMERLSPYIGAELGFVTKGSKSSYTDNNANTTVETKGAWSDGSNRGFTSIGLNVLAGADFYFAKKIYLGTEVGFGFQSMTMKEVEVTSGSTTNTTNVKASTTDIGFNFNPAIRLGFWF